jgi:hypothetical protein
MTAIFHFEPQGPPMIDDDLDALRFDEIGRLAALAASYFHSIELAADRGDELTVAVHLKQAARVTREAFALAGELAPKSNAAMGK